MSLPDFPIAESHFEQDAEGWTGTGDGTPSHNATGGNPGGCLQIVDPAIRQTSYFKAPEKFLGNKASATRIEYDIKRARGAVFEAAEIKLTRGDRVLHFKTSQPPRDGVWLKRSVTFAPEAGWTNETAGRPATERDFEFVLGSLDDLQIRGEYISGRETTYLDNVVMYFRKEPPTLPTL